MLKKLKISSYTKVIFILLILLIVFSVINLIFSVTNTLNIIKARDLNSLRTVKSNLENYINYKTQDLSLLATIFSYNFYGDYSKVSEFFKKIINDKAGFYSISFIKTSGFQQFTYPSSHPFDNQNIFSKLPKNSTEYNSFLSRLNSNVPVVSSVKLLNDKKYGLNISVPVYDSKSNTRLGSLVGRIDFNYVADNFIFNELSNSQSSTFVVSQSGELLLSNTQKFIGKHYNELSKNDLPLDFNLNTFRNMEKGIQGSGIFKSYLHTTESYKKMTRTIFKTICYKPIRINNKFIFSIAVTTPLEEVGYFIRNIIIQVILILIFGLLILHFVNKIHQKSLKQEVEKAKINAELQVANEIIDRDQTILEQNDMIELQNKEIIEQKNLVDQLYKEALEYNKNKTEFFSNIAHELKTPISVILSTVQLMNLHVSKNDIKGIDKAKYSKHINSITQNSYRVVRLINSLLQITKVEAGFVELNFQNINIIKLIRDICFSVTEYVAHKNILFEFNTNVDKKIIATDPEKIERIMLNLLSNAAKFTHPGGKISVNITDKKHSLLISVKDTGIGIPKDKTKDIFERFKQGRTIKTKHYEGIGIGLSLVKKLVELHNGKIDVNSEVGKGTEFLVCLPITVVSENNASHTPTYINDNRIAESINVEFSEIYSLN